MFKDDLLAGKRVLVTGGGTGLGRSITQRYMSLGAHVVICGRREDVLKTTVAELSASGSGSAEHIRCDIRDPDAVDAVLSAIWKKGAPGRAPRGAGEPGRLPGL